MFKQIFILCFVLCSGAGFGQDTLTNAISWTEVGQVHVDSGEVWTVDQLNNIYVVQGGSIIKYDSSGVQKFQQSIKSFGKLKQIVPVNSMKIMLFSEEQQTICFCDNTLTPSGDCVDLVDKEIYNATMIAASSRATYVWVYDNVNSRLKLISLNNEVSQQQEIVNVQGILGVEEVSQIIEESGKLFLLGNGNKTFELDFYGSLVSTHESENVSMIEYDRSGGNFLYSLKQNSFSFTNTEDPLWVAELEITLPKENIIEFMTAGSYIYLRTPKIVHKYTLDFND